MKSIYTKVTVDSSILEALPKALAESEMAATMAVAQAASMHVAYTMEILPAEVQGKTKVSVFAESTGEDPVIMIQYEPKGGESGTIILPGSRGATFIPEEKLGEYSAATRQYSREGDVGRFLSRLSITGRPSIDAYLKLELEKATSQASAATEEEIDELLRSELRAIFASHNINYNPGLQRYQAGTGGATIPFSGVNYSGGQIVAGAF